LFHDCSIGNIRYYDGKDKEKSRKRKTLGYFSMSILLFDFLNVILPKWNNKEK